MTLTIGSLFSGVGGLELGLEWAGLGPVLWQVEKEPFCRAVLAKHYPEAQRFDDVCTVGVSVLEPVDLICGGFPCQDVSSAGGRAGLSGARSGLWYEFARILGEMRPRWVVVENVASGADAWVDAVRGNLEELGYASLPVPISARDVGAPHLRKRVFLVAHVDGDREPAFAVDAEMARSSPPGGDAADTGSKHGQREPRRGESGWAVSAEPDSDGSDGRAAPDLAGLAPRSVARSARDEASVDAPHALPSRRQGTWAGAHQSGRGPSCGAWGSPEPGVVPVVHGLSGGLAGRRRRARIRALGNSVVPQDAEVVGHVIRQLAETERAR